MNRIPIRLRVTLLAGFVGALVALIIGGLTVSGALAAIKHDLDVHLAEEALEARTAVENGLTLSTFAHPGSVFGVQQMAVYDETGRLVDSSGRAIPALPADLEVGRHETILDQATGGEFRYLVLPVDEIGAVLVTAVSMASLEERNREIIVNTLLVSAASVAVVLVGSYLVAGAILKPVEALRRSAAELAENPSGRRLSVPPADDEVRRLAETLNESLEKVEVAAEAQRRFVTDASHELRTPLARLRADVDLAMRPTRTREELLDAMARFDEHAAHLASVAESLLGELAPAGDRPRMPLWTTGGEILKKVEERIVTHSGVEFSVPQDVDDAALLCDPHGVISSISNLVENALRHGDPPVEVSARRRSSGLEFTVRDHGPGIPPELRQRVLEPYFSGSTTNGGTGLGLAIVHEFAKRQGGELMIEDAHPGCRMVLQIPFSPVLAQGAEQAPGLVD